MWNCGTTWDRATVCQSLSIFNVKKKTLNFSLFFSHDPIEIFHFLSLKFEREGGERIQLERLTSLRSLCLSISFTFSTCNHYHHHLPIHFAQVSIIYDNNRPGLFMIEPITFPFLLPLLFVSVRVRDYDVSNNIPSILTTTTYICI